MVVRWPDARRHKKRKEMAKNQKEKTVGRKKTLETIYAPTHMNTNIMFLDINHHPLFN
jgi:hypothetical protein